MLRHTDDSSEYRVLNSERELVAALQTALSLQPPDFIIQTRPLLIYLARFRSLQSYVQQLAQRTLLALKRWAALHHSVRLGSMAWVR